MKTLSIKNSIKLFLAALFSFLLLSGCCKDAEIQMALNRERVTKAHQAGPGPKPKHGKEFHFRPYKITLLPEIKELSWLTFPGICECDIEIEILSSLYGMCRVIDNPAEGSKPHCRNPSSCIAEPTLIRHSPCIRI